MVLNFSGVFISLLGIPYQNTAEWVASTTTLHFLTVLVARSPRSSCGHAPETSRWNLQMAVFSLVSLCGLSSV